MDPHPPNKDPVLMSESAYIIPPSIFPDLDLAKEVRCVSSNQLVFLSYGFYQGRIYTILDAFLSPVHIARLRALLQTHSDNDGDVLQNLWLLSPSIHKAFRGGQVNVQARGLTSKSPEDELEGADSAPEVSPSML